MLELLVVLTVVEVALVLGVLAVYLSLVRGSLRTTATVLGKVAFGVRAIETQTSAVGPGVMRVNDALHGLAATAPQVVDGLDRHAGA